MEARVQYMKVRECTSENWNSVIVKLIIGRGKFMKNFSQQKKKKMGDFYALTDC